MFLFGSNPLFLANSNVIKDFSIDYEAIISKLSYDFIIGNRTFISSIKLIDWATTIEVKPNQKSSHKKYWNFNTLSSKHTKPYSNLLEEGLYFLENAITRYKKENSKILIPLSGGLDSRTIASFLSPCSNCNALHIDYGFEKKLAQKISNTLNIPVDNL